MRQIKFRAWDKLKKEMVDGLIVRFLFSKDDQEYPARGACNEGINTLLNRQDRFLLHQFTGLLDSNSKEIYEGDIVGFYMACGQHEGGEIEWDGATMKIEWDEKTAGFKTPYSDVADKPVQLDPGSIKVLGNIYENPDLLNYLK